jgi:antitoxin (DNA-binding transcriptional repressor) of toxin-antitoxin stability system
VKTITVRDVRLHWPRAEQALRAGELIVTRDGTPVARLLPFGKVERRAPRFVKSRHLRWLESFWARRRKGPSTDDWLARDRDE